MRIAAHGITRRNDIERAYKINTARRREERASYRAALMRAYPRVVAITSWMLRVRKRAASA